MPEIPEDLRQRCLKIIREGPENDDFDPGITQERIDQWFAHVRDHADREVARAWFGVLMGMLVFPPEDVAAAFEYAFAPPPPPKPQLKRVK